MDPNTSPGTLYVLGMLSLRRTYGHEIIKAIKLSRADRWVSLSDKHVYYVLRKLARNGLVTETEERIGKSPPRKVYEITKTGRQALREMLRSEVLRDAFVAFPFDAVVGMLAFTDVLTPEDSLAVLLARRQVLARRLADEHPDGLGDQLEPLYGYLARAIYEKAKRLLVAELQWLDEVIQRVRTSDWDSLRVPRDFLMTASHAEKTDSSS